MLPDNTINAFITKSIGDFNEIKKLQGDASTREYYRIFSGGRTVILCIDNNFKTSRPEKYSFLIVYELFKKNGVPVPEIYSFDSETGALIIQDLGDGLLESAYPGLGRDETAALYSNLIDIIIKIQSIRAREEGLPFNLSFDVDKLMFEFNFFIEHALLNYFKSKIDGGELDELRSEFAGIAGILYRPELFVLNHRDYHSRNIILHEGRPFIIDFQDARMGLPQYDAVSLLRDSYLSLDAGLQDAMRARHYDLLRANGYDRMSREEYDYYFDIMAFQRNVKAIGTFGYQVSRLGKALYAGYIPRTLGYLKDYAARRSELRRAWEILSENVEAAL